MIRPFYSLEELHQWASEVQLGLAFLELYHLHFLEIGAEAYLNWMRTQLKAQQEQCHSLIRQHYSQAAA